MLISKNVFYSICLCTDMSTSLKFAKTCKKFYNYFVDILPKLYYEIDGDFNYACVAAPLNIVKFMRNSHDYDINVAKEYAKKNIPVYQFLLNIDTNLSIKPDQLLKFREIKENGKNFAKYIVKHYNIDFLLKYFNFFNKYMQWYLNIYIKRKRPQLRVNDENLNKIYNFEIITDIRYIPELLRFSAKYHWRQGMIYFFNKNIKYPIHKFIKYNFFDELAMHLNKINYNFDKHTVYGDLKNDKKITYINKNIIKILSKKKLLHTLREINLKKYACEIAETGNFTMCRPFLSEIPAGNYNNHRFQI